MALAEAVEAAAATVTVGALPATAEAMAEAMQQQAAEARLRLPRRNHSGGREHCSECCISILPSDRLG